ncbi:alpha/beta fold hydrolase [Pikeienuella piscinae]|uniref:Alpha/beta fold hydrolase n=1 Tax=Pikeienuella piscinae TaxID=2748098 RepID=A0A7M3T5I9_9RHOB|nr:alpha/beta fold hydrolase [Pikeienuella piscinae]QIE57270.1 alpha/beta fold hydrolase [Pikeienuella piscinae]
MATEPLVASSPDRGAGALRRRLRGPASARRIAVLLHGRDGSADSDHMRLLADAYIGRGWSVLAPDLAHSRATPGSGDPERFSMTGHVRDARAAIGWVQARGPERLALAGHSIGAYAAAELAEEAQVDHLIAVSPVLSGAALLAARRAMGPDAVAALAREAPEMRREMEALDAAPALARCLAPVAVMTGARDALTPPCDALAWFRAARVPRFFSVLPGESHCPTGPVYRRAIEAALDALEA